MIREKKIALVKIKDIWFDDQAFLDSKKGVTILHSNDNLDEKDYDFRFVKYTLILDVTLSEEELYKKMNRGCRGRINRAEKSGIVMRRATTKEEVDRFSEFQQVFCKEKGIPLVSRSELDDMEVFLVEDGEGNFLGGAAYIISGDGTLARYKYGATTHESNANEVLLWKAICEYHNRGCHYFDFGGTNPTDDESSYYYKNYMFKKKFGGDDIESYLYFKVKGFNRIFYYGFMLIVKLFFKGNVNDMTVWLNSKGLIK